MNGILKGIGTVQIWYTIIITGILAICLCCIGSISLTSKEIPRVKTIAQVISKECSPITTEGIRSCIVKIKFTTKNGNMITTDIYTELYKSTYIGDRINILYSLDNPIDAILEKDKPFHPSKVGLILILCGGLCGLISYLNHKYRESESYKTYSGVVGSANIISSVISD